MKALQRQPKQARPGRRKAKHRAGVKVVGSPVEESLLARILSRADEQRPRGVLQQ